MDHLQEYYEAVADQEHVIANPVVGMNCVSLFAGVLHVNIICLNVGRFLPPCSGICFLLCWQGWKKCRPNCLGQVTFALGSRASENCLSSLVILHKNVSLIK